VAAALEEADLRMTWWKAEQTPDFGIRARLSILARFERMERAILFWVSGTPTDL